MKIELFAGNIIDWKKISREELKLKDFFCAGKFDKELCKQSNLGIVDDLVIDFVNSRDEYRNYMTLISIRVFSYEPNKNYKKKYSTL